MMHLPDRHVAAERQPGRGSLAFTRTQDTDDRCGAQPEVLQWQAAAVSPHQLRHGLAYRLWKRATPAHIQRILGHSGVSTTLKYGKPTEDDLRAALEEANRVAIAGTENLYTSFLGLDTFRFAWCST